MGKKKSQFDKSIPADHESGPRRLVADSRHSEYEALASLSEAKNYSDAVVILEGDHGGQIYVVAPIAFVKCSETTLERLVADIDALEWADPDGARILYERRRIGTGIPGGMGGASVYGGVWVHERLSTHEAAIASVLSGNSEGL